MNFVAWIMAAFAILGALDRILGNKFGIGKEFERGLETFGSLALSMIGMIVLAPVIAEWLRPALLAMAAHLPIDPSIVPASFRLSITDGEGILLHLPQKNFSANSYFPFINSGSRSFITR